MPDYDTALLWLRRDLRLGDHAALHHALKTSRRVYPVFVFDRDILEGLPSADRRVDFIHRCVVLLKADLEALGSSLIVLHGRAREAIPRLAAELRVGAVFFNHDEDPAAIARDAAVTVELRRLGVVAHDYKDVVIFERDELLTQAGRPFSVFTPYRNAWLKKLGTEGLADYSTAPYQDRLAPLSPQPLPPLASLGFSPTDLVVPAGEKGAQALLADFLERIDRYREARDYPAVKGVSYLSTHLRFGTISIRQVAAAAWARGTAGAQAWLTELIWRDFFHQVLWQRPDVAQGRAYQSRYDQLPWPNPPGHLQAWCEAHTGYPLVDAAMRQLNQTGYMHNRLRMVTASFLTKDLLVDWRLGEAYFAARLLDFDLAANNGGWQWAASTGCDAQPWFRIFNPVTQSQKFDPQGKFIRRYLPELVRVPDAYLHAPWTLPPAQQQALGLTIGRDYPAPLIDHAVMRQNALALFKAAAASGG